MATRLDRATALTTNQQLEDVGRMMLISCGGNASEAVRRLRKEHHLKVSRATLERWRDKNYDRYEELRKEMAPKLEAELAEDMLANAHLAMNAERVAIEQAHQHLVEGKVNEPTRWARDLSQAKTQAIDKRLALEGRPTQIVEKRSPDEILAKLEALGVAKRVDVESTAIED